MVGPAPAKERSLSAVLEPHRRKAKYTWGKRLRKVVTFLEVLKLLDDSEYT